MTTAIISKITNQYPLLSHEEEVSLFNNYTSNGCLESMQKIILSNMRYVIKLATQLRGYGLNHDDLVQEGTIGLMKAAKKYKPTEGVRFLTYAKVWVQFYVYDYIERNISIVRKITTKAHKRIFYNISKYMNEHGHVTDEGIDQIAKDYSMSKKVAVQSVNSILSNYDANLDELPEILDISKSQDNEYFALREEYDNSKLLSDGLALLNERQRQIIEARYFKETPDTLEQLSKLHGVSLERVRQIEKQAIQIIKSKIGEVNSISVH